MPTLERRRTPPPAPPRARIERLNTASARAVVDPDVALPGGVGPGQLLPDELLAMHELPEFAALTDEQRIALSRAEVASITESGLRFEAVLMAGFALDVVGAPDLTDPAVVYALHEIGEETRHSRLFSRLLSQLGPQPADPLARFRWLLLAVVQRLIRRPATLDVLVLAGEEIPDLLQKRASEHPSTDPFLRAVNRYHRAEEARHLAFARTILAERWASTGAVDRFLVRRVVPRIVQGMFDTLVHPGVYAAVGLPTWSTWKRANRSPARVAMRHEATRPLVATLLDQGVLRRGAIPRGWRSLAGVSRAGEPVARSTAGRP